MKNDDKHATPAVHPLYPPYIPQLYKALLCLYMYISWSHLFCIICCASPRVHPPCPFGQCPNEHISYRGVSLIFPSMRKYLATMQFKTCPKINQHCCVPDVQNLDSRCVCPVKAEPEKLHRLQITALGPTCFLHLIVQQTMRPSWMSGHSSGHCLPWLNQFVPLR